VDGKKMRISEYKVLMRTKRTQLASLELGGSSPADHFLQARLHDYHEALFGGPSLATAGPVGSLASSPAQSTEPASRAASSSHWEPEQSPASSPSVPPSETGAEAHAAARQRHLVANARTSPHEHASLLAAARGTCSGRRV